MKRPAGQLSLFEKVREGADWLQTEELQAFLEEQGLADVQLQLVGPRRSYAGKAWPPGRIVRLVSVNVHPLRWLVTLLHELAHIADYDQRVRDLEAKWRRQVRRTRHDGRAIWRLDRSHGQRWQREFSRLTEAAIAAGLFPGNEAAVRAHAASGAANVEEFQLDLAADPRLEAEELRRQEERARLQAAEAARQIKRAVERFVPGATVHFDAGPRQGTLTGTMVRANRKTCTVDVSGVLWRVPPAFLQEGPAPLGTPQPQRHPSPQERFTRGQAVIFRPYPGADRLYGTVLRVNRKTCTVQTEQGPWRVAFSLLKPGAV